MTFLQEWDAAIRSARRTGFESHVWKSWFNERGEYNLVPVARTMHPSFMAVPVPKHDPERDK